MSQIMLQQNMRGWLAYIEVCSKSIQHHSAHSTNEANMYIHVAPNNTYNDVESMVLSMFLNIKQIFINPDKTASE